MAGAKAILDWLRRDCEERKEAAHRYKQVNFKTLGNHKTIDSDLEGHQVIYLNISGVRKLISSQQLISSILEKLFLAPICLSLPETAV